jgi:hypothetical protein
MHSKLEAATFAMQRSAELELTQLIRAHRPCWGAPGTHHRARCRGGFGRYGDEKCGRSRW